MPSLAMSTRIRPSRTKPGRKSPASLARRASPATEFSAYSRPAATSIASGKAEPEGRGEAAVAGVQLTDLLDHEAETVPRIGVGEPLVDDDAAGAQLVGEGLGGQQLLGREVTVQGGGADPGAPGDLPHRHVHSFGIEHRAGRVEDALAVVQGVGAQVVRPPRA